VKGFGVRGSGFGTGGFGVKRFALSELISRFNILATLSISIAIPSRSVCSMYFNSWATAKWLRSSVSEPRAIIRNWMYSLVDPRPRPSAIFAETETAALRIWDQDVTFRRWKALRLAVNRSSHPHRLTPHLQFLEGLQGDLPSRIPNR
jgi:hypothetical protein